MNNEDIWLRGALTTQGYLLELLLGAQFRATSDPNATLERARASLKKQIQFDMRVPPTDTPSAFHLPIQAAAVQHLDEMLDRVLTQLGTPSSSAAVTPPSPPGGTPPV